MNEIDAAGDVVLGGALAKAAEPATGRLPEDGHTGETACLNCGTALVGDYCHACGQRGHVHRTIGAFFHDLVHGVLHFEGKVWRTLPLLAWRPGELTRNYIDGQRARFVSPIALFLFSVFLLFAVGGITGGLTPVVNKPQIKTNMNAEIAKNETTIAALERERAAARQDRKPTATIDAKIEDLKSNNAVMKGLTTGDFVSERATLQADNLPDWLRVPVEHAARNPELLLYKVRTSAYKYSWALIPISVPFVWLLFPFSRRFRIYDHVVFVTYSLCFMSLLAVTGLLFSWAGMGAFVALLFLVPPIHMYRQLRGAYALSGLGALARAVFLTLFAFVAVMLFVLIVAGLGMAG